MKRKITNRLFFEKWSHKIVFQFHGARWIAKYGEAAVDWVSEHSRYLKYAKDSRQKMKEFVDTSWDYVKKSEHMRSGGNRIYMYFNDPAILDEMTPETEKFVYEIWAPKDQQHLNYIVQNANKIMCKKLPKGKYRFKITLKSSMPRSNRQVFLDWISKYSSDHIHITPATKEWLTNNKFYLPLPYFYVNDHSMMTLCCMILGQSVNRIEEYITNSEIQLEN